MHRLLRICSWIFLLLIFLVGILFSFFNTESVSLSFGFVVMQPQPLSVWVITAFALGGLIGLMLGAGIFKGVRSRIEIQRLLQRVESLEKERKRFEATRMKE
ncbi:MAG: lipopolysaccharide assembly protein LapA domain-containing protein [Gammaproteobacteria bacterium]|nr:lipopolysaccharide assembly protein LapA domain-containing protein [Gammaproteobacteria bacterium]MDP2140897.1 lipopolysaccharide assembly protein LapA domain-containing protein [Gammaproteobacteria bacterium]MDP2349359.1 lipopolysaccharide assembly protein LapA domain-containing protein [Gammaproteobacteria bacterium]